MTEKNEEHITSIVLLATGEYSDYRTEPFRVLKPFTMRAASEEFRNQWKPTDDWIETPRPEEFTAWLAAAGYIEDLPVHEVHVGSYGDMRIERADMLDVEFAPGASPAALTDEQISDVFLENGFWIEDGQTDLRPYVYKAARALLALAASPADQVEDARHKALAEAAAICQQEGDEWDSDAVQTIKNYAHACRDRIRAAMSASKEGS